MGSDLKSPKTLLNPLVIGKIQGLFKAFECFSSTIQDNFSKDFSRQSCIYQVLFKPVHTMLVVLSICIGRDKQNKNECKDEIFFLSLHLTFVLGSH